MERITKFNLPEVTEDLHIKEAKSSIALTKEVASKINELVDAYNELNTTRYDVLNNHEQIIRQGVVYMKDNLANTVHELFTKMNATGEVQSILDSIFTSSHIDSLNALKEQTNILIEQGINVKSFGAKGNGISDDTKAIQDAIDYAVNGNKIVFIPAGVYVISKSILLKGVSLIGSPINYINRTGTIFKCSSKTFTAIKQDNINDNMFNLSNIIVRDALVGFEINRAIHSKFESLAAASCEIGFKIGDSAYEGCEYTEFNHIITDNCRIGVEATSSSLFQNNKFSNSYLNASTLCMHLQGIVNDLNGNYHNVFENVTFKTQYGRGIELYICRDVTFTNCLFECGGNAIRCMQYSTISVNNCCFKGFAKENVNDDINIIYCVGTFNLHLNHGSVYVTSEHNDIYFYGTDTETSYGNITVSKPYIAHGGGNSNFKDFANPVNRCQYVKE